MKISFITANFVAEEVGYNLHPFVWAEADRATVEAFHGPQFATKFENLVRRVKDLGFDYIDIWVAHLNPWRATDSMVDEAVAILRQYGLTVVAYTAGLGRPHMTTAQAERVYQVARRLGTPILAVGLHPTNEDLAYRLGREYGIRYAIENHPEKTPDELLRRIGDRADILGVTSDTGFWGFHGFDPVEATYRLKDVLLHVHLKDVIVGEGRHESCAYGRGVVDIRGVVQALRAIGYQGAVSVEHEPHDRDPSLEVQESLQRLRTWLAAS